MTFAANPNTPTRRLRRALGPIGAIAFAALLLCQGCAAGGVQIPEAGDSFHEATRKERASTRVGKAEGGTIERADLIAFLDKGPAHLLGNVQVSPVLDGESLLGFRIDSFFPNRPSFHNIDIEPGDVLTGVNGVFVERPEDLFRVWEELRTAPRLQLDVIRKNTLRTLTWEILDETHAAALP